MPAVDSIPTRLSKNSGNLGFADEKAAAPAEAFGRQGDGDRRHGVVECRERSLRLPGFGRSGCRRRACRRRLSGAGTSLPSENCRPVRSTRFLWWRRLPAEAGEYDSGRRRRAARDDGPAGIRKFTDQPCPPPGGDFPGQGGDEHSPPANLRPGALPSQPARRRSSV